MSVCSPADQLVLEAFYKENPKPNKAARAEILKDVKGMTEKEVQVRDFWKLHCSVEESRLIILYG